MCVQSIVYTDIGKCVKCTGKLLKRKLQDFFFQYQWSHSGLCACQAGAVSWATSPAQKEIFENADDSWSRELLIGLLMIVLPCLMDTCRLDTGRVTSINSEFSVFHEPVWFIWLPKEAGDGNIHQMENPLHTGAPRIWGPFGILRRVVQHCRPSW